MTARTARFYLGTHLPHWLSQVSVPLFVARQRLELYKTLPRAITPWALDSGAFSEVTSYGRWSITPRNYVSLVRRFRNEVGMMKWAAPMDWMCEPFALRSTGMTVVRHQKLTAENYVELRMLASDLPFRPVLQGWTTEDYQRHVEVYDRLGVQLADEPLVGLGSVCRRQGTAEVRAIVAALMPLRLHGFGVKMTGLASYGSHLISADSLAWSYDARRSAPLPQCSGHKNCANCQVYALRWRRRLIKMGYAH